MNIRTDAIVMTVVLIAGFVLGTVAKYVGYSNIYWCAAAMALGAAILIRRPKRE